MRLSQYRQLMLAWAWFWLGFLACGELWNAGLIHAEDKPKKALQFVRTTGELLAPIEARQNYRLRVVARESDEGKEYEEYLLAFDDMHERYKAIQKELPNLVGKFVTVEHREGFIKFGKSKALLARDIKVAAEPIAAPKEKK